MAAGWAIDGSEFESMQGQELPLLRVMLTGSAAHPASFSMASEGVKRPKREASQSPPTSAHVTKT
jgi:hypothetical protein